MTVNISEEIGQKIRYFRKRRGLTLEQMGAAISKSRATTSKYETGEITLDVITLYEIASVLEVEVEQILYFPPEEKRPMQSSVPAFFQNLTRLYTYRFDGRSNSLLRGVIDISTQISGNSNRAMLYLDVKDLDKYQNCRNTYVGSVHHFDVLSRFEFHNQDSPSEFAIISVLNAFADSSEKWALFSSISSHPLMPCASKTLLSKKRLPETEELKKRVTLSKEDIRIMKMYNMFVVPG